MKLLKHSIANPDNWWHDRYQTICDRMITIYLSIMYSISAYHLAETRGEIAAYMIGFPAIALCIVSLVYIVILLVEPVTNWIQGY